MAILTKAAANYLFHNNWEAKKLAIKAGLFRVENAAGVYKNLKKQRR
jgi:hypothetical protein